MIYTITLNPALDYIAQVDELEIGKINRIKTEKILPGGKGLNVSIVLKNLGIDNIALGVIAGFTGDELKKEMEEYKIKTDFVKAKNGITRINVKINSKQETALNGNGPQITSQEIEELLNKIEKIEKNDIVILAGNVPQWIKNDIYEIICIRLRKKGITFIVDSSKELLINILKYRPFLIKPNKEELEETFEIKINTREELIKNAKKLQQMGAQNVLISLGEQGAILVTLEEKIYFSKAPRGKVINTVGAGDSMIAGFIAGFCAKEDYKYALKMGIATGSASAFSANLATKEQIQKLFEEINTKELVIKD